MALVRASALAGFVHQPMAYDVERGSAPPARVPVSGSTVIAHTRLTPALQSSSSLTRCPRPRKASRTGGGDAGFNRYLAGQ